MPFDADHCSGIQFSRNSSTSERSALLLVQDMLDSIQKIRRYTYGLSQETFQENDLVVDAVVRNLEVIGEAARQIPEAVRERYPTIPWRRVIGLRHVVVHAYFYVDLEIVWKIVAEQLPVLEPHLLRMRAELKSTS